MSKKSDHKKYMAIGLFSNVTARIYKEHPDMKDDLKILIKTFTSMAEPEPEIANRLAQVMGIRVFNAGAK